MDLGINHGVHVAAENQYHSDAIMYISIVSAWYIYRESCAYPTCEFNCPENSGCFTYARHSQYTFDVTCWDAYGSTASGVFTLNIIDNTPPAFKGLSKFIMYT